MLINKEKIEKLKTIFLIAPDNGAITFLFWRLLQDKYRGTHLVQHNRWTFEKFKAIMFAIFYTKNNKSDIKIPRGDEGKNYYIGEYPEYKKLINLFFEKYNELTGKGQGTPNSIKKNLFVDLSRMGIINRYHISNNKILKRLDPWSRKAVDLININESINLTDYKLKNENFLYNLYVEKTKEIYANLPSLLFEIISDTKLKGYVTNYEFLFFVTWHDYEYLNEKFDQNKIIEMILYWRKLKLGAQKLIINFIKSWADRKKFHKFPKNQKRDFENWKNETQEIMKHFKDSKIFVLSEYATRWLISFKKENGKIIRYRNEESKKEKGFEFDHIVPFSWSTTHEEAIKICSWKNLIYLDGKSHAIKSQSNNKYVYLDKRDEISYIYLAADDKDFLALKLNENVIFNMHLFDDLKNYNKNLNNLISNN